MKASEVSNVGPEILVERIGPLAQVTLNRPDAFNTLTSSMLDLMQDILEDIADTPEPRVVILSGAGRAFCAGGDLRKGVGGAVAGPPPTASQARRLRTYMRAVQLLRSMPAVTVAAIHGACAGAGLSLACAADIRICQRDAKFNTAFLAAGLSGDFGGTWLLQRIIGSGRARELYLNPTPFDADRALEIGLVSEVCDDVEARAQQIGAELVARAPLALRRVKANLNDAEELPLSAFLDIEAERHTLSAATDDAKEATSAFLHHREPVFHGR